MVNYLRGGWWLSWGFELNGLKILVSVVQIRPGAPYSKMISMT